MTTLTLHYYANQCYQALKPLAWVLIPCGLDLKYDLGLYIQHNNYKIELYKTFLTILSFLFLSVCITFDFLIPFMLIYYPHSLGLICFYVAYLSYANCVAFLRIIIMIKNRKLRSLFKSLSNACDDILRESDNNIPVYKTTGFFVKGSLLFIVLIFTVFVMLEAFTEDPDDLTPEIIIDELYDSRNSTKSFIHKCSATLVLVGSIIILTYHALFLLFYMAICVSISEIFKILQETVKINSNRFTNLSSSTIQFQCRVVLNFIRGHDRMCSVIRQMDDLFKEIVGLWNFIQIMTLIFSARSLNIGKEGETLDREVMTKNIILILAYVLNTLFAARINEQVQSQIVRLLLCQLI